MIGIDLGTTNSAVSVIEAGFPIILADENNLRLLPSLLAYENEAFLVGHEAQAHKHIRSIKSLIGRQSVPSEYSGAVTRLHEGIIEVQCGERWLTPVEVSAEIIKKLKQTAEYRLQAPQTETVITVPAYFNDQQRLQTKEAAEMAGLTVRRLIAEPTAAALTYGLERASEHTKIAVYDLGGGTFDLSILEMRQGNFEVLATCGDTSLGGDDFDQVLADLLNCSLSEAREAKVLFDTQTEVQGLSAEQYEKACWKLLQKSRKCCERALIDSGVSKVELDRVILVGGSTKMPLIRSHVAIIFDKIPDLCMHPDEAVALGAGIQAGLLSGAVKNLSLLDVTPLSLGVETVGGLMNIIIPRNTTIPCKKGEMFTNASDTQSALKIKVLQGEREFAKDNWILGEFEASFTPTSKGQARIGIQFELDEDGLLTVLARDMSTGVDKILKVDRSTVDITQTAVEKMIDESIDHAHEDMNNRVFSESKVKADELLASLEEALSLCEGELAPSDIENIRNAQEEVVEAISKGNGFELKNATQRLDESTEELASIVMQKLLA